MTTLTKLETNLLNKVELGTLQKRLGKYSRYKPYIEERLYNELFTELCRKHEFGDIGAKLLDTEMLAVRSQPRDGIDKIELITTSAHVIRAYEKLSNIIGIQPLTTPSGLVFKLRYDPNFTNSDGTSGLSLALVSEPVEAVTRKCGGTVDVELANDLMTIHGLDVKTEIQNAIGSEVGNEIITEVLTTLFKKAKPYNTAKRLYRKSIESIVNHLEVQLFAMSVHIAGATRRGAGNFIVVSPSVALILMSSQNFVSTTETPKALFDDFRKIGVLNNTIDVFVSRLHSETNTILMGYKNKSNEMDSGYILAPYRALLFRGITVDSVSYTPSLEFLTRFGTVGDEYSGNYYMKIDVTPFVDDINKLYEKNSPQEKIAKKS